MEISQAQRKMKDLTEAMGWEDFPNIDKFDHVHEELIGMSQHLRYKSREEMEEYISENKEVFTDGIGDTLLALMRLANQLGVDAEEAFTMAITEFERKYANQEKEVNILNADNSIT
ncbi:hypothetical protein KC614_03250 [candidate division WWE3 bacterium]|uniref:NTP pyrophosphohydrolase MazG putative catalytic core domain-containing protein n=1 Tax=candidate division WWE3 bacterium TaxID=2053526 RepID=A0A955LK18_UNCKA|nr:hypothetical protein [candidate division WWE3 bacterium]